MPLLKGVHCDHLRVEVASEARGKDCVPAALENVSRRIDEHSAHAIVSQSCSRQRFSTRDNPKFLICVMRALRGHAGKTRFQVCERHCVSSTHSGCGTTIAPPLMTPGRIAFRARSRKRGADTASTPAPSPCEAAQRAAAGEGRLLLRTPSLNVQWIAVDGLSTYEKIQEGIGGLVARRDDQRQRTTSDSYPSVILGGFHSWQPPCF